MPLPTCGQLAPTLTHKAGRRWAFLPSADATSPSLGTLTIVQSKRDTISYGVALEEGQVLFLKLTDGEVYGVTLDRAGRPAKCSCPGYCFKKTCKHCDCTKELLADGVLDAAPAHAA
ncbi:hypothetical protein [Limnoglobus roseus]|uniref:SWIM-type domain-containing protein n=1 Tax=Limnoglobus roseus TaxID=2598579 RepID=A0A5C1AIB8_9BACT|nr:hypothetical protein [Limnoglobus roseus]QEL17422.1 hypothetical protein PX52LOC_04411 [Limnoglobus roseus]